MILEIKDISENESILNFSFKKEDYIDEFKKEIAFIRDNINIKGFRKKNTPTDILYREYGGEILSKIINRKITDELKKLEEDNKNKGNIMYNPILIENNFPQEKLKNNITEIKNFDYKFIYCYQKEIDIDTLKKKLSDIKIDNLYCREIEDDNILKISSSSALIYNIGKEKIKIDDNDIVQIENENRQELYIPSHFRIDNDDIDLKNKQINDTIELPEGNIIFNDGIFDLINYDYNVKNGGGIFKIVKIFSRTNNDIGKITTNTIDNINLEKNKDNKWLGEFLNIDFGKFKNNINNYNDVINFQNVRDIALYQCNQALEDIMTFEIKNLILDRFDINIPNYMNEKVKQLVNDNNDEMKEKVGEIIKNEIILENIKNTIKKENNLSCTKEDIVSYVNTVAMLKNTVINNLVSKYFDNKIKNKFLINRENYEEIILDLKAMYEIKKMVNVNKKEITYNEFLNISN